MPEGPVKLDERDINVIRSICTVLYAITIFALAGVQLYRQFVLGQPISEHEDIAIILTANVLVFLGTLLYVGGGVNPRKWRLRWIIAGYAGFVLFGLLFTIFKYAVLLEQPVGLTQVGNYFLTVLEVSGALALLLGLIAYLGSRRIEKQIE
jgi:hypothetical protein